MALEAREVELIREAVTAYLDDQRRMLVSTDAPEAKHELGDKVRELERLAARLGAPAVHVEHPLHL